MSIEPETLRHGLFLATGAPAASDEAEELAATLGVPEEALAFVLLRRAGFSDSPRLQAALAAAAARSGGPVRTSRPAQLVDAVSRGAASADLHKALKALIEDNLEGSKLQWRADDALRGLVELQPASPFDEIARFEPGEWRELRKKRRAAKPESRSPASAAERRRAAIQRSRRRKARKR
ncbi:MAG TPA: hypothetical protein VHW60_23870 [Caulobacteraceae bacterium]|jgi:hypothetical protein|nr:hypothetical protein [Caulobacteraceae bacterium]